MKHKLKFWTSPTQVDEFAERFEKVGLKVLCKGTEHIYVEAPGHTPEGARWDVLVDFEREYQTTFGLR